MSETNPGPGSCTGWTRRPAACCWWQKPRKPIARCKTSSNAALCVGDVQPARATIDKPLGRDPANRQRMGVIAGGRAAQTEYAVTERYTLERRPYSLLRVSPRTGRTHQIRVHLASTGFPVAGDLLYGGKRDPLTREIGPRHMLHASELVFELPSTGAPMRLHAPLPEDMRAVLARLESL
jgi:23S rRNA pseudouridine1911/1915/1917 synthase